MVGTIPKNNKYQKSSYENENKSTLKNIEIINKVKVAYVNKNLEKLTALSFSLTLSDKINTIPKQTEHEMANIFPFMSSPAKLKSEINIKNDPVSTIINPITRFKPIFLPK